MVVSPPPNRQADIVARLRAAGCVFAEDEARLLVSAARTPAELAAMVARRADDGLPLEHVLGWAEFRGLRIAVDPGVFVPRRRTEFLVEQAVLGDRGTDDDPGADGPVVVDLCCGSGAVGVAVVAALGRADLHAVDLDPAAARCARRNVSAVGGRVYTGDLYGPLPRTLRGRVAVLVANAPYVPTGEIGLMPPEARVHEPMVALDGGGDGLDVLRRVIGSAAQWLAPGGHLLFETSRSQASAIIDVVSRHGLRPRVAHCDEVGATAVICTTVDGHGGPAEGVSPRT